MGSNVQTFSLHKDIRTNITSTLKKLPGRARSSAVWVKVPSLLIQKLKKLYYDSFVYNFEIIYFMSEV